MVLGQRYLPYLVDPNSCQLIRIFHPRDRKSPLARLLLAPWQPLCILLVSNRLLLLLSLVFLYSSNLQASVQKHLYEPVTILLGVGSCLMSFIGGSAESLNIVI